MTDHNDLATRIERVKRDDLLAGMWTRRDIVTYLDLYSKVVKSRHRRVGFWVRLRFAWATFRDPGKLAGVALDEAVRLITSQLDHDEFTARAQVQP